MQDLRSAVIGVGALGRHHARILSELEGVELVAVADPHEEHRRRVAESCGCEWTHDHRTLLQRVDAASIAGTVRRDRAPERTRTRVTTAKQHRPGERWLGRRR